MEDYVVGEELPCVSVRMGTGLILLTPKFQMSKQHLDIPSKILFPLYDNCLSFCQWRSTVAALE